eukprot:361603-Chlamydomonas_euryale.AAC.4
MHPEATIVKADPNPCYWCSGFCPQATYHSSVRDIDGLLQAALIIAEMLITETSYHPDTLSIGNYMLMQVVCVLAAGSCLVLVPLLLGSMDGNETPPPFLGKGNTSNPIVCPACCWRNRRLHMRGDHYAPHGPERDVLNRDVAGRSWTA